MRAVAGILLLVSTLCICDAIASDGSRTAVVLSSNSTNGAEHKSMTSLQAAVADAVG